MTPEQQGSTVDQDKGAPDFNMQAAIEAARIAVQEAEATATEVADPADTTAESLPDMGPATTVLDPDGYASNDGVPTQEHLDQNNDGGF